MILENHWYEVKQTQSEGFFKDLNSSRTKDTISYFPKIYYRMTDELLSIRVQISLGKISRSAIEVGKKLESGLYCGVSRKGTQKTLMWNTPCYTI